MKNGFGEEYKGTSVLSEILNSSIKKNLQQIWQNANIHQLYDRYMDACDIVSAF